MRVRPAATLCLLRPAPEGLEMLMVRRHPSGDFAAGAYVFPGGTVEDHDRSTAAVAAVSGAPSGELLPWMAAALRETGEEAGVWITEPPTDRRTAGLLAGLRGEALYEELVAGGFRLDASRLAYLSNWVTPPGAPRRFDTRFFVAAGGEEVGGPGEVDGREVVEVIWVSPAEALSRAEDGAWELMVPTRRHLELPARFAGPEEAVAHARARKAERVEPELVPDGGGGFRVVLPGGAEIGRARW